MAINLRRLLVHKYSPLSIARYSFIQLSELEQCRVKKLARGFNTAAQDSNPGSLSRESEALPLSHCTLKVEVLLVLQVEIKTTNEQLQKSGLSLMAKGQELVTYRKIERNIDSAIETLNLCLPGESYCPRQGFMQDQIIASHTCFGGHVDVNC